MNWVTLYYQVKFSIQSFKPLEDVFESALRTESPKRDASSRNSSLKCSDQRFSFVYSIKSDFCDRHYAHLMQTVARQRCVNAFISSAIIILGLREMDEKSVIHPTEQRHTLIIPKYFIYQSISVYLFTKCNIYVLYLDLLNFHLYFYVRLGDIKY